jgi:GxxExxY protein
MPINPSICLRDLTQAEFDERDVIVMRCAYAAQNALGRLCDERVYENDVALRLRSEGFTHVHTQVPVVVTHRTFAKEYLIDLMADDALYECKTVSSLAPPHDAQALHYAMLLSVRHTKLLNFRAAKVQGRLRFNALTDAERRRWVCDDSSWRVASDGCAALKRQFCELLMDWGAFLETRLYEEALIHFNGGESECERRVPVARDGVQLGTHPFIFHSDRVPFVVTAVQENAAAHRNHLLRLIKLTAVPAVQWINLDRHNIRFETL